MAGRYAQGTTVSSELSRIEIEKTLLRYGATGFAYAMTSTAAMICFTMQKRRVRFILPLPQREEFSLTPTGKRRVENSQTEAWEQACRQRWRALNLVVKAKLEAVESGISCFEQEFMANIVLPNNTLVGDFMIPQIRTAYATGNMPPMLPGVLMEAE